MWRASRKTVLRIQNRQSKAIVRKKQDAQSCDCTSESPKLSGLRTAGIVTGGLLLGAGLTYFYARNNPGFRNKVEKYVPGAQTFFLYSIGPDDVSPQKPFINFDDPLEKPLGSNEKNKNSPVMKSEEKIIKDSSQEVDNFEADANSSFNPSLSKPDSQPKDTQRLDENQQALDNLCLADAAKNSSVVTMDKPDSSKDTQQARENQQSFDNLCLADAAKNSSVVTMNKQERVQQPTNSGILPPADAQNNVLSSQLASPVDCLNTSDEPLISDSTDDSPSFVRKEQITSQKIDLETQLEYEASAAILEELLSCCSVTSANAILLSNAAADATALHSSLLRTAIDDVKASPEEKSFQWGDVSKALDVKEKKLEEADLLFDKAKEELDELKEKLERMNMANDLVRNKVEEICSNCSNLSRDLMMAKSKVTVTLSDAEILDRYHNSVVEAKEDLQKNFSLPEMKVMQEWQRESQRLKNREDIEALRNMQFKVEELKHKLVEERDAAMKRFAKNVESIKMETEKKMIRSAEEEKNKVLEETKLFYEAQLVETKSSLENEMAKRLKEQSSLHAEHLAQALTFMDKQASEKYENALQKEIEDQWATFQKKFEEQRSLHESETLMLRDQYQVDLGVALAKIEGIRKALEGRAMIESETRKAQELSLACDSLLISIKYGDHGNPIPLARQLDNVKQVYSEHPAIAVLSTALPEEAHSRGVYPEDVIRNSFSDVARQCRRLSMVDEKRNSLWVYIVSYMKSLLTLQNASLEPPQSLVVDSLTVFDIVSYATHCIEQGNIEQAVRFLSQLRGESRIVADWWIREARLYLETKQSIDALNAVSSSIVIGAQLE